ncbi:tripartite tricarboxylate transporter substrate-binding protein [Roseomonas sp. WA12]
MRKISRRTFAGSLAGLSTAAGTGSRPLMAGSLVSNQFARALVGFPAGGSIDIVARLYSERLRGKFATQVVVENRTGAGGRVALDMAKVARPDGSTFILTPASTLTVYPSTYSRTLRYDPLTDFTPVSPVCAFPFALAIRADHPARSLAELAAWAKLQPVAISFASPAAGSMPHFLGVQVARALSISTIHVPYRGAAPALQDLLSKQISFVSVVLGDVMPLYRAGQVRILGISAAQRLGRVPELPTFAELGHPELTAEEWFGFLLPAWTPATIVESLSQAVMEVTAMTDLQNALALLEYRSVTSTPLDFAERIRTEQRHWASIVAASDFSSEE